MTAPIAIQLYTLRDETATGMEAVLRRLAEIGYVGVEPAGFGDLDPAGFRRVLDDTGLRIGSAHTQLPLGSRADALLDEQETIGNTLLIAGGGPPDFESLDTVKALAEKFNAAAANAAARGMTVGYHNHWWEFEGRIDGRLPHTALFDLLEPGIVAEVDIYWAKVGGADPATVVKDLGERAKLLHVKDGPCERKMPMTAVGTGAVDIDGTLAAAAAAEWHIVELDACATDMFEAVEQSHRYLVGRGLSTGR